MGVTLHVDRVMRYASGSTKLCSSARACVVAYPSSNSAAGAVTANYTDLDDCSGGCPIITSEEDVPSGARGRKLHFNWWFHSHASGSNPSPSPPTCQDASKAPSYLCSVALMKGCNCRFNSEGEWEGCDTEYYHCSAWNGLCWGICGEH